MSFLQRARLMTALVAFDVFKGAPAVIGVLVRRLGVFRTVGVLVVTLWRGLRSDPLRGVPTDGNSAADVFSRHQFRSAVILDAALLRVGGVSESMREALVEEAIAAAGARFIAGNVPVPDADAWAAWSPQDRGHFVRRFLDRFLNAEARVVEVTDEGLAFDVERCHFAELAAAIGRPTLAGAYCAADRVYFDSPGSPLRLERAETIATGGTRCPFRMRYSDGSDGGPQSTPVK